MNNTIFSDVIECMTELFQESGRVILRYYGSTLSIEEKSDKSPVTIADREAEDLIRERILRQFPDHGYLGEETGSRPGPARQILSYLGRLNTPVGADSIIASAPQIHAEIIRTLNEEPGR